MTPAQWTMLRNILACREPGHGLVGRSAHGGASGTLAAIVRRGWVERGPAAAGGRWLVTAHGSAALRAAATRERRGAK